MTIFFNKSQHLVVKIRRGFNRVLQILKTSDHKLIQAYSQKFFQPMDLITIQYMYTKSEQ